MVFHNKQIANILEGLNKLKGIAWQVDTHELLQSFSHLPNNICIIGPTSITLVLADNQIDNINVSSFVGATKAIKLRPGNNKSVTDF